MIKTNRPLRRAFADAALGLTLFVAFTVGLLCAPHLGLTRSTSANAAELARIAAFTGPIATQSVVETVAMRPAILVSTRAGSASISANAPGRAITLGLLAMAFTVLFSFNLAFFRHLRRVYADPSKRRVVQR